MPENEKTGTRSRKTTIDAAQFEAMLNTAIRTHREETTRQLEAQLLPLLGKMEELKAVMRQIKEELAAGAEDEDEDELLEQVEAIMSQPEPEEDETRQPGTKFIPFTTRWTQPNDPRAIHLERPGGKR